MASMDVGTTTQAPMTGVAPTQPSIGSNVDAAAMMAEMKVMGKATAEKDLVLAQITFEKSMAKGMVEAARG